MFEGLKSVSFKETENGYDLVWVRYNGSWNIFQHESTDGMDYSLMLWECIDATAWDMLEDNLEEGIITEKQYDEYQDKGVPAEIWDLSVEYLFQSLEENGVECLVA